MGSYVIDFNTFTTMAKQLEGNCANWSVKLGTLSTDVEELINSNEIQGVSANSLKLYFQEIHSVIIGQLFRLCEVHKGNYAIYRSKYTTQVDTDIMALIKKTELDRVSKSISNTKSTFSNIDGAISRSLNSISDIYTPQKAHSIESIKQTHDAITKSISDLDSKINAIESDSIKSDFTNTDRIISEIKKLIEECKLKDRTYKTSYVSGNFMNLASWEGFVDAAIDTEQELSDKENDYKIAIKQDEKIINETIEYREKQANAVKFAVGTLCVVASVVVVVATAGAASPLVAGCLSAGTAVANSLTDDLTGAYVEDGDFSQVKFKDVGKNALVAGSKGFVEGYVGGSIGKGMKNLKFVKSGMDSANLGIRILTNTGTEAVTGTIDGIMTRATENVINDADHIISGDGKFNFKESVKDTLNLKKIRKDALSGGIKGLTGEVTDSAIKKTHIDSYGLNNDKKYVRVASATTIGGGKSVVSGIENRTLDVLFADDEKAREEAKKNIFRVDKMANDFVKGGAKEGAKYMTTQTVTGREITKTDLKDEKIRSQIPTDVVEKPENWIKNGGKIYMDSKGKVTFESRSMKARGGKKDNLYYSSEGDANWSRSKLESSQKVYGAHFKSVKASK